MDDPCLHLGFVVTGHDTCQLCTADVSNFDAVPPDVGKWVWGNIGLNSAGQLYLTLEDNDSNLAVAEFIPG